MVGWSRRARDSERRRKQFNAWWDTLTPEQKEKYKLESAAEAKRNLKILGVIVAAWLVCLAIGYIAK